MLGKQRRTTRLDVGLALAFAGLSYLVWSLIAGSSRQLVQVFIESAQGMNMPLPEITRVVRLFFVEWGFIIDLVGLAWMMVSLVLVLLSSWQKIRISWAWMSAILQSFTAGLGAVLVGTAVYAPHARTAATVASHPTILERVSQISLPVIVSIAIVAWTTALVWLLVERSRWNRRGPSLRDGLRMNVHK